MARRLMIGAGGTGGHVYPALAVAEVLSQPATTHKLTYIGTRGGGGFERPLVEHSQIPFEAFEEVFAGPVVGVDPLRAISSAIKMGIGLMQSIFHILKYRPEAILMTGGWANVPLAFAGWFLRVPMLMYLPDIEPGSTIRLLRRFVAKVATTVPDSAQYFPDGKSIPTGYPLRQSLMQSTREQGHAHFKLDAKRRTLLITGGSRGARSINLALGAILPELLNESVQIIHVTGTLDFERTREQVGEYANHPHYHLFDYLESEIMGLAYASADIVLARAGASVLGEFPYFGIASLLVPYPHAWRYQRVNADWLAERGAAIRINDENLDSELLPTLQSLLQQDSRLQSLQESARALYTGNGAERLAQALLELAGEKKHG